MATTADKIKALEEKLKQERAKLQKEAARKRAAETKLRRAQDTRRKILIGAYVLDSMEQSGGNIKDLRVGAPIFSDWLKRPDDRALFGLG